MFGIIFYLGDSVKSFTFSSFISNTVLCSRCLIRSLHGPEASRCPLSVSDLSVCWILTLRLWWRERLRDKKKSSCNLLSSLVDKIHIHTPTYSKQCCSNFFDQWEIKIIKCILCGDLVLFLSLRPLSPPLPNTNCLEGIFTLLHIMLSYLLFSFII